MLEYDHKNSEGGAQRDAENMPSGEQQKSRSGDERSDGTQGGDRGHGESRLVGDVSSLNEAIRQELGYLDAVVATPFRAVRRTTGHSSSPWAKGLDELLWAFEGMARVPVKMLQAAFGEPLPRNKP